MSIFEIYCKIASSMNSQIVEIKEKLIIELTQISSSKDFPFLFLGFIKHELKELSSTKEVEFLETLSNVETNSIDPKAIDKNNLTKEKYYIAKFLHTSYSRIRLSFILTLEGIR